MAFQYFYYYVYTFFLYSSKRTKNKEVKKKETPVRYLVNGRPGSQSAVPEIQGVQDAARICLQFPELDAEALEAPEVGADLNNGEEKV